MIYLDNAATTRVDEKTALIVKEYLSEQFYNPSALYNQAVDVARDIKTARIELADLLGVSADELYFLSSGTEADNAVLFNTRKKDGTRIIISKAEHSAVYNTANELKQNGFEVVYAPVNRYGRVIIEEFVKLLDNNTSLVSIIHVNNETGAINDIEELSKAAKAYNKDILFHSDGVQAFTKVKFNLNDSNVDFYSISGHKVNAPKGIAGLYIRKGINIRPILFGGGQEKYVRSSTENVAGIISFNFAAHQSILKYSNLYGKLKQLLQFTANLIIKSIPDAIINTDFDNSAPNILSIAFKNVRGEVLMHSLEQYGIMIGIGSACNSKKGIKRIPSALNLPKAYHDGIIRLSISPDTSKEELQYAAEMLIVEYNKLNKFVRG